MQFIAMQMACRISNPLMNEQKTAAQADVRVRQHGSCEWINGLEAPWSIQPHSWNIFTLIMRCFVRSRHWRRVYGNNACPAVPEEQADCPD